MLKGYGNKKGRSKFVSYKPHFHTYPISYIQYCHISSIVGRAEGSVRCRFFSCIFFFFSVGPHLSGEHGDAGFKQNYLILTPKLSIFSEN